MCVADVDVQKGFTAGITQNEMCYTETDSAKGWNVKDVLLPEECQYVYAGVPMLIDVNVCRVIRRHKCENQLHIYNV